MLAVQSGFRYYFTSSALLELAPTGSKREVTMSSSFFAYPSQPVEISSTIRSALQIISDELKLEGYHGWEETEIAGRFIIEPILAHINDCEVLAADVTRLNFNVTYEIGYAIARKRRLFLTRNSAMIADDLLIREVGIYDTLGYKPYQQARELATMLAKVSDFRALDIPAANASEKSPVYIVLPKARTDFEVHLLSQVKKARLRFRSFDPEEQGRLSGPEAIRNVAISYGVIVPLIPTNRRDAEVHNLRAAFVAGLAHGMERELLLLQFGEDPVPLDYRDFVKHINNERQIDGHIAEFAPSITELLQSGAPRVVSQPKTFLGQLNLGASAAENEMSELSEYYLETDEYRKVSRGEVQLVAGRKGSGKSALFFRVRDKHRPGRYNIVLDLRPESFQLRKFKDVVLVDLEQGTKEHIITAFWEYLLLLEICHKILEKDKDYHLANHKLYQPYTSLAAEYRADEFVSEGDFAERTLKLIDRIMDDFATTAGGEQRTRLNTQELANILYKHDTRALREKIGAYLDNKRSVWILFDNLDKGWPPKGLDIEDVLILRCLVEAMSKLEKYLRREGTVCHGVVFLRNDVYELLVENTTDRGKASRVVLDWTDSELLREMLRKRLVANNLNPDTPFETIWQQICVSHVGTQESSSYLIDRCLMRPRSLIELVYACRTHAVNLGHQRIELDDIREGETSYSSDLVENIGLEMRDVYPNVKPEVRNILYEFIGSSVWVSEQQVMQTMEKYGIDEHLRPELLDILLWWGFFGVAKPNGEVAYIYSVQYHMNHLKSLIRKGSTGPVYYVNPAFWAGLEIQQ